MFFRYFTCPHCKIMIDVLEMNCKVFRCGIYKSDGKQIPPHLTEEECKALGQTIWGCSKPFLYNIETKKMEKCDYI